MRPYGFVHLEGLEDARHDARLAQPQPEGLWRRRMEPHVGRVARRRAGVLERVLCRCRVPVGSEGAVVSTWDGERVLCRCRVPLPLERDRILSLHLMREALNLIREAIGGNQRPSSGLELDRILGLYLGLGGVCEEAIRRQLTTLTLALAACVSRAARAPSASSRWAWLT